MKFRLKNRPKPPALSMTSMLDVIFLLLFYFAAMSVKAQWEYDFNLKLPQAKSVETPTRLPGELVLNVDAEGRVTVNGAPLALDDLERRLAAISVLYPEQTAIIRADGSVRYEKLLAVMDSCRAAGVSNFSLATAGEASAAEEERK